MSALKNVDTTKIYGRVWFTFIDSNERVGESVSALNSTNYVGSVCRKPLQLIHRYRWFLVRVCV